MTVFKHGDFFNNSSGAGMTEVLLTIAIVAAAAPFAYSQIVRTNDVIRNVMDAKRIIALREPVLNFVRMNQDAWPDVAQIQLSSDELAAISDMPRVAFIDKYSVRGASVTDVYIAFDVGGGALRANQIARNIGDAAAVVADDGIAYGAAFAVSAPEFKPGDLIYRVSRDVAGVDMSAYLHRGTSGEDGLNMMLRNLNMGGYNIFNVGTVAARDMRARNAFATFVDADRIDATNVYFQGGANMDGGQVFIKSMRVTGDVTGFRNIVADNLNGRGYTTAGRVIADRATVKKSVNVAHDLNLKSDSVRTISGFTAISANAVETAYVSADEIIFQNGFGLTVSGELLVSAITPLKVGAWSFSSMTPPRFVRIELDRAVIPEMPSADSFAPLMGDGWRGASAAATGGQL